MFSKPKNKMTLIDRMSEKSDAEFYNSSLALLCQHITVSFNTS